MLDDGVVELCGSLVFVVDGVVDTVVVVDGSGLEVTLLCTIVDDVTDVLVSIVVFDGAQVDVVVLDTCARKQKTNSTKSSIFC